ncbi:hypothetical protein ACF0H5_019670 [Mactra antiquata]
MYSQEVVLMNTTGEFATFGATKPLQVVERNPPSAFNGSSAMTASVLPISNDSRNSNNMSIAFREVFKDYALETKENQTKSPLAMDGLCKKDKFSESFYIGDKLLKSDDNMRPKSRSRTVIVGYDHQKYSQLNGDSQTLHAKNYSTDSSNKDCVKKSLKGVLSPMSDKGDKNGSNNAQEFSVNGTEVQKKGKRGKKRNNSPSKSKKGKHGQLLSSSTRIHDRDHQLPNYFHQSSNKPSRISSEPPRKISQNSTISHILSGSGHAHVSNDPNQSTKQTQDMHSLRVTSAKHNPSIHYTHGNSCVSNIDQSDSLQAQGQSVMLYKLDFNARVKSANSMKSDSQTKPEISNTEELTLNAVSCNLQQIHKQNKSVPKQHGKPHSHHGLSLETVSKEAVLTSIYGAVYSTADKVTAQAEELKKVKKVFLSDKQSGTIRENGMEFPCAPPATPTPDVMRRHEYIPSMSDIRSQRAVRSRLQVIEKDAIKKQEKKKEANAKMEKIQSKEKEKQLKVKQRREIYALNKVMTELENKRFLEFCQAKGLNKA